MCRYSSFGAGRPQQHGPRLIHNPKGDDAAVISGFYYTAEDVGDGKSVHLQPPAGGSGMTPYAREAAPSAGIIDPGRLSPPDNRVPDISHTPVASADRTQPLTVSASVYDADGDALKVKLFYKTAVNSPYSMIDMVGRGGDQFDAVIPADQLIGEKRSIISKRGWNSAGEIRRL